LPLNFEPYDPDAGLAAFAALQATSRGRIYSEPSHPYRGEFQRDRDRIIHSAAFRRLVYKTQVFVNHEGDLYRTRLTHSLEVAQIAETLARQLRLSEQLVEAICLAHDLGHTPFGHAGQDSLNKCMRDFGGFEHNLQSLRVVDELEEKYANFPGLNLTFETREGILKHCSRQNARKLGELGQRFLDGQQPGLEAQLVNVSDAIAYNHHDIDDGLRAGLLEIPELCELSLFGEQHSRVLAAHPDIGSRQLTHETVRAMINVIVTDLLDQTRMRLEDANPKSIDDIRARSKPLVAFSDEVYAQHIALKKFLNAKLYRHEKVLEMTDRADRVVTSLFEKYFAEPETMPVEHAERARADEIESGENGRARVVADYVAGMTDRYAYSAYKRLIDPSLQF
jgi:dGTPase